VSDLSKFIAAQAENWHQQIENAKQYMNEAASFVGHMAASHPEFLTAVSTTVVAIFTYVLARSTKRLWITTRDASAAQASDMKASIAVAKQSADAAKKAADAADLQAKTLFQAELPIVLVRNFRVAAREGEAINQLEIPEYPILHFTIFNYGRTPAELVSYCVEQKVAKRLPETPEYEERLITPGTVLSPHGGKMPFMQPLTVMGRDRAVILNESEYLWLYGFVKFNDFMGTGKTHETRFATMGLLRSERPGQWLMFVYSSETPPAYAERT
jgi:hypothetical protein